MIDPRPVASPLRPPRLRANTLFPKWGLPRSAFTSPAITTVSMYCLLSALADITRQKRDPARCVRASQDGLAVAQSSTASAAGIAPAAHRGKCLAFDAALPKLLGTVILEGRLAAQLPRPPAACLVPSCRDGGFSFDGLYFSNEKRPSHRDDLLKFFVISVIMTVSTLLILPAVQRDGIENVVVRHDVLTSLSRRQSWEALFVCFCLHV